MSGFSKADEQELNLFQLARSELWKAGQSINEKIDVLRKKQKVAERTPLIGKCFKYPNSYSDNEKWWEYVKFTGFDSDDGDLIGQVVSKDSRGIVEFKGNVNLDHVFTIYITGKRAVKITPRHYEIMKNKFLKDGGCI